MIRYTVTAPILTLSIFLYSCAGYMVATKWKTYSGMTIYDEDGLNMDHELVNRVIGRTVYRFHQEIPTNISIVFVKDLICFEQNDKRVCADGSVVFSNSSLPTIYISQVQKCSADNALVHELAHIIYFLKYNRQDNHEDIDFWDKVREVEKEVIHEYCPRGYKHENLIIPREKR